MNGVKAFIECNSRFSVVTVVRAESCTERRVRDHGEAVIDLGEDDTWDGEATTFGQFDCRPHRMVHPDDTNCDNKGETDGS